MTRAMSGAAMATRASVQLTRFRTATAKAMTPRHATAIARITISLRISAQVPISASGRPSSRMNTARGTARVLTSRTSTSIRATPAAIEYSSFPITRSMIIRARSVESSGARMMAPNSKRSRRNWPELRRKSWMEGT